MTGRAPDPRRGANFPVTKVTWDDAQSFIWQLNAAKPGLDLSLPSEAQWEYACRAGTDTPYNFGTTIGRDLVCYDSGAPVPVGSLPPSSVTCCPTWLKPATRAAWRNRSITCSARWPAMRPSARNAI